MSDYSLVERIRTGNFSLREDWEQTKEDIHVYGVCALSMMMGGACAYAAYHAKTAELGSAGAHGVAFSLFMFFIGYEVVQERKRELPGYQTSQNGE